MRQTAILIPFLLAANMLLFSKLGYSQRSGHAPAGGLVSLALRQSVLKELGIDEDKSKIAAIESLGKQIIDERLQEFEKLRQKGPIEPATRANIVKNGRAKFEPQLKVVLDPQQYKRLKQISWQQDLAAALADKELVAELAITDGQLKMISAISEEFKKKSRDRQRSSREDVEVRGADRNSSAVNKELGRIEKERDNRLQEVLSKEQQQQFSKLKGDEFDFKGNQQ